MGGGASLGETIAWYLALAAFLGGSAFFAYVDLQGFAAFVAVSALAGAGLFWLVASINPVAIALEIGVSTLCAIAFLAGAGFVVWT